jgi:hypothetical protein
VAKGRLAAVNGRATLKLKLKRKLKKGTYTFTVTGTDDYKRQVTGSGRIRVR